MKTLIVTSLVFCGLTLGSTAFAEGKGKSTTPSTDVVAAPERNLGAEKVEKNMEAPKGSDEVIIKRRPPHTEGRLENSRD